MLNLYLSYEDVKDNPIIDLSRNTSISILLRNMKVNIEETLKNRGIGRRSRIGWGSRCLFFNLSFVVLKKKKLYLCITLIKEVYFSKV